MYRKYILSGFECSKEERKNQISLHPECNHSSLLLAPQIIGTLCLSQVECSVATELLQTFPPVFAQLASTQLLFIFIKSRNRSVSVHPGRSISPVCVCATTELYMASHSWITQYMPGTGLKGITGWISFNWQYNTLM